MTDKYEELKAQLKNIFQIDRTDLDFGIYRILNSRAKEIGDFLDKDLKSQVEKAFSSEGETRIAELKAARERTKNAYLAEGFTEEIIENSPKINEIDRDIQELQSGTSDNLKNSVYSHLLTFFSRYYEDGDFISKRRYNGDKYVIPYSGEEVKLVWANQDQYYTKSSETFRNYAFTIDGARIEFRIVAADTEKDNVKEDTKRVFALVEEHVRKRIDENGDEVEETVVPIEIGEKVLVINFVYRPVTGKNASTEQKELVSAATKAVLSFLDGKQTESTSASTFKAGLAAVCPTDKDKNRTRLEKELTSYVAKNTADYFIHKDLKGFLYREMDNYLKNEVLNLDDVMGKGSEKGFEERLSVMRTVRSIGHDLIDFMAQLEDFQKRLWLKKKFVVKSEFCITLDRIEEHAPELVEDVWSNPRQIQRWVDLGFLEKPEDAGQMKSSEARKYLTVDTGLFPAKFKASLLAKIEDFDAQCDGLLIHSDNFQALRFLESKYSKKIDFTYIDPPYNTSEVGFLYKNGYHESSWATLMMTRLQEHSKLLSLSGVSAVAIDDFEFALLQDICDCVWGREKRLGNLVVEMKPSGRTNDNFFATSHDYHLFYANEPDETSIHFFPLSEEQKKAYKEIDDESSYKWRDFLRTGGFSTPKERPNSFYPIYYNPTTEEIDIKKHEGYEEIYPIDSKGNQRVWRKTPQSFMKHVKLDEIKIEKKGEDYKIRIIDRIKEGLRPKSVWVGSKYDSSAHGSKLLTALFGETPFSFPKSLNATQDIVLCVLGDEEKSDAIILDYFGGSGTTAHAVINLNREDGGKRKYILVEMGKHFDTVLKPRVEKVVFSKDWKDGKPQAQKSNAGGDLPGFEVNAYGGVSHCFKYMTLESYEDVLNNLRLAETETFFDKLNAPSDSLKRDVYLHYFLDVAARDSLLNTGSFTHPFDYTMNIATDSAGAMEETKVDLVETFNYLLGLRVKQVIDRREKDGFVWIEGTLPKGDKAAVIWRDLKKVPNDKFENVVKEKLGVKLTSDQYAAVYVNGDSTLQTRSVSMMKDGGETVSEVPLKSIEEEFLSKMFED